MKKWARLICIETCVALGMCGMVACSTNDIEEADPESGTYSTQTSMTTLDYGIFMGRQATTFLNQLTTHISMLSNADTGMYENEVSLAESSLSIMQDAYDNVVVTMPAEPYEDDREGMLLAMETAIGHMESYINDLSRDGDITRYETDFKNDLSAITAYVNMYYR